MKIRHGFVSNSSSSSFVCEVTGRVEAGYDMPMEDAEMVECTNGHIFSEDLFVPSENIKSLDGFREYINETDGNDDDWRYEIPAENCPICSMAYIAPEKIIKYIFLDAEVSLDDIKKEIVDKFKNVKELDEFLKEK